MKKLIKYGHYTCQHWNEINGLDDPLFVEWFESIKSYLVGYEMYIYGGVLEGWPTHDIDATIIGPNNPQHVNWMLDKIVERSFKMGFFPDIKYSIYGNIFKWSEWEGTSTHTKLTHAYYQPMMQVNRHKVEWGIWENGYWIAETHWPMKKQMYKNHKYKDPVKIF